MLDWLRLWQGSMPAARADAMLDGSAAFPREPEVEVGRPAICLQSITIPIMHIVSERPDGRDGGIPTLAAPPSYSRDEGSANTVRRGGINTARVT